MGIRFYPDTRYTAVYIMVAVTRSVTRIPVFKSSTKYKYLSEVQFLGLIQYAKSGFTIAST